MGECLYVNGTCTHAECAAWPMPVETAPVPTIEDYCASADHAYHGNDAGRGRCYCGQREYPEGGGAESPEQFTDAIERIVLPTNQSEPTNG